MGVFRVNIKVAGTGRRARSSNNAGVMVDTGSELTWLPAETLQKIGIEVRKKDQPFIMANGQRITRDVGYAVIHCGEFETIDEIVFAHLGDYNLLGSCTLECFNAQVRSGEEMAETVGRNRLLRC